MRSVEKQPLSIALATGMDEETDPRGAQPGVLYAVRNCRIRSTGSLQKRCGTKGLDGTTNVPQSTEHCFVDGGGAARPAEHPAFIRRLGDQLLAGTTAGEMFSNDLSNNWNFAGCFSSVLPLDSYALTGGADVSDLGSRANIAVGATSDGYVLGAYIIDDSSTLRVIVRDPAGRIIYQAINDLVALASVQVRAVVVSGAIYVLWQNVGGDIYTIRHAITGGVVFAGSATVVATAVLGGYWDTSSYDGTNWFLFYPSGVATWRLSKMLGPVEASGTDIAAPSTSTASIWADPVNSKVWIGMVYDVGGAGLSEQFAIYDATNLTAVSALAIIDAAFGVTIGDATPPLFGPRYSSAHSTDAVCVLSVTSTSGGATVRTMHAFTISASGSVSVNPSTRQRAFHMLPLTKPDVQQRVWCRLSAGTSQTAGDPASIFLVRCADAGLLIDDGSFPVEAYTGESVVPDFGYGSPTGDTPPWFFHEVAVSSEKQIVGLPIPRTSETNDSGGTDVTRQAMIYEYATASVEPARNAAPAPLGLFLAGQATEITVSGVKSSSAAAIGGVEVGFPHAPVIISTSSAAGAMAAGTRAYVAIMQWYDTSGRRQLSAVSEPKEVVTTVASRVTITVAYPGIGQRPRSTTSGTSPPVTLLYRTTDGGENYQLLPLTGAAGATGSVVFTDEVSDAILAENEFLYIDGGVLPNVMAPTCRFMCSAEDRIWCGGLWDRRTIEASKVIVPNEPLNFTGDASHQVVLPDDCTGLAYMDGQVVAFSATSIYLVGGDGPNDQGAGSFLPPRLLTRGVGCINYLSVLETAIGIIFQSAQGIYLLPRGFGAPQYIGIKAQDTMLANPTILSAVATTSSEYRLARFLIAPDGETESETILTFDIDTGNWFVDTYQADDGTYGSFSILGEGPDGCAMVRNTLTSAATPVWYEDESQFYDNHALVGDGFVGRYVETAWMAPFTPAGWGRVNKSLLFTSSEYGGSAPAQVHISLEVDTDGSSETHAWDMPAVGETVSFRSFDVTRRDCTFVRGIITETGLSAALASSRGPKFLSLSFEIESQGGIRPAQTDSERASD